MIRSFLRNQISICFMIKANLVCRASSFLSTTKTFVSTAYRTIFIAEYLKVDHIYIY